MKQLTLIFTLVFYVSFGVSNSSHGEDLNFKQLFNGKDLSGWININTKKDTWWVEDGLLKCTGHPIGVMRSDKQYENFILKVEWRHMEAGGNSGIFAWSSAVPREGRVLPDGLEIQMLELEYAPMHNRTVDYVHGELFGVDGVKIIPDNPRGTRSKSAERRCKGKGQWNEYVVVCVDGVAKLSVNGKFVNGIRNSSQKKGYFCLESEGAEIHFRKIEIMELPPGITSKEQTAPLLDKDNKPVE